MKLPITLLFPVLMTLVVPTIAGSERMVKTVKRERSCGPRNGDHGHHGSKHSVSSGSPKHAEVGDTSSSTAQSTVVGEALVEPTVIPTATDAPVITPVPTASQGSQESASPPVPVPSNSVPSTDMAIRAGLGWNSDSLSHMAEFIKEPSKINWAYSWGLDPEENYDPAVEFVPMIWGRDQITQLDGAKAKWPVETKTILSFNEPDMTSQANLNAAEAAKLHTQWTTSSAAQGFRIGAPATARGGKKWFTDFDAACKAEAGCHYDFIPIHFYGDKVADFITYAQDFHDTFGKPIWVTEYACLDFNRNYICTESEAADFMTQSIEFFRKNDWAERWAWFGMFPPKDLGANTAMDAQGMPNTIGKLYSTL